MCSETQTPVYDFVVLGGGLAGLTFASEVGHRGRSAVVVELDDKVGGLARTVERGEYRFDLGGHRFHSKWPHLTGWLDDLLGDDLLDVPRRSRINLDGRYVEYPLRLPGAVAALSPSKALRVGLSYLRSAARRHKNDQDRSFEDWVVRRFGRSLYEIYFQPYTEKVWGMPCTELSADWADRRIRVPSLSVAIRGSLLRFTAPPSSLVARFRYPRHGIGAISERLAGKLTASGRCDIRLSSRVSGLSKPSACENWTVRIESGAGSWQVQGVVVVSTIPPGILVEMLDAERCNGADQELGLAFRSLVCVLLALDTPKVSEDTWTYFPDKSLTIGRTHEPANWSPEMAPEGKSSLCVELFCDELDSLWCLSDEELVQVALSDLRGVGFLEPAAVTDAWVQRVPNAYPVYRVGYGSELERAKDRIAQYPNLHLLGRTGSFQYLNMDGVIAQALDLADALAHR